MSLRRACELISSNEKQNNEEVKKLIKNESLFDAVDTTNNALLHHAATVGNHEIVQYLVDSGSKVDALNYLKQTPLMITVKTDFPCKQVTEVLLKAGANIFVRDVFEKSALKIVDSTAWLKEDEKRLEIYKVFLVNALDFDCFELLEKTGNQKVIKMLLQTNIDLSAADSKGNTLVHALAKNLNPGIMSLLHGKTFDMNARNESGWTPLMHAVFTGANSAVEFLIDEGADVEAADNEGRTALYIAFDEVRDDVFDKHIGKCIQALLEHGANAEIYIADRPRPTIFDAILERQRGFSQSDLVLARLALQEAKNIGITQVTRSKIESHIRFKTYSECCKQQLSMEIYPPLTLFDILTASEWELERCTRNPQFASKLTAYKKIEYFDMLLSKRLSRASEMAKLRETSAPLVGMLIGYGSYFSMAREIVSYLDKKDMENLISMESKLIY